MASEHDVPPSDEEILAVIRQSGGGVSPKELVRILAAKGHSPENMIVALQRVFDRGLVDLSDGAKLVEAQGAARAAA